MIFNSSKYNGHWQDKKLSDLGSFRRGKSRHRPRNDPTLFKNGVYPLIQTGEIKQANLYINNHNSCYNDFGLSQSELWPKNTLCITIAANIAETALLGYPMCFPDSVVGFNAFQDESSEIFMHYVFTYIRKAIQNSASGSIQDNINIDYLTSLKFKVPLKKYQDKVTLVLSVLDQKIELNNRINAELEAMAKTLYDYWFVQFDFPDANGKPYKTAGGKMEYNATLKREIPVGWEACTLGDLADLYQPQTISEKEMVKEGKYLVYGANGIIGRFNDYNHKESVVTITCRGNTCGNINITRPYSWITGNAMVVKPKNKYLTQYYLYNLLTTSGVEKTITGSAQPQITRANLAPLKTLNPKPDITKKFSEAIENVAKKNISILNENEELIKLRDWLLPLLMNGQVTVK
ncbi:restriction endonuclease subunit S [Dickeya dianthicola]|uniref:Restriction endonuclease subunit S n=1 Tax=Dickeya dianthicola TaxID=204039 RepID=A0ABX9NRQ4_9GAMM|nr:restriction endonuclease subunit S [Dickeya dianthicola]MCI4069869.1 restriction endonuclease subunit S [Dickeya dianthicola]MCI4114231.1 restriction endonuclease subunit S [Dickeya dianthicola]MCI4118310.1 restriction endonuclease subunit S [Dickeya dianthicola]MCI4125221.1 restriction endonuclease subunit S [Dickeya dianthicola]MCI4189768.1 restriction endonuclease subunit S [Dickeya dianthicola]